MKKAKSYVIPPELVTESYKRIKANHGSYGIDHESICDFEKDWKNNLYKIWNRMSSGSYFPPPVRVVEIPKSNGGVRQLGIPTVSDRIAQMICKMVLEPKVEPFFHNDSYGYRPNKSALEAVGKTRERCWKYQWIIDLDIKGYFDNIDHGLVIEMVRKHTAEKWIHLYIERWLKAEAVMPDGRRVTGEKGTPQGGVISPLLANLYLHYAFDAWMKETFPAIAFARYADDIIVHCRSLGEVQDLKEKITRRLQEYKLKLHPQKTKVVYCQNGRRNSDWQYKEFDFLGYTFRPRGARTRYGKNWTSFLPAISRKAAKKIRDEMRMWRITGRTSQTLESMAEYINPKLRGWINYYGRYYKSALHFTLWKLNLMLVRWVMHKYKKFRTRKVAAIRWLGRIARRQPSLFYHWQMGYLLTTGQ